MEEIKNGKKTTWLCGEAENKKPTPKESAEKNKPEVKTNE